MSKYAHVSILIAASLLLLSACQDKGEPLQRTAVNAAVGTVQASTQAGYTEVTGTVQGQSAVPVSTKLMSAITFLPFDVGDRVKKGAVLARIDDSDIQGMLAEAAAYRAEATAALGEVDAAIAQGQAGKTQAEAALAQAKAAEEDAKRDYERFKRLADEDTVPKVAAEKYELGYKVAQENVARAQGAVAQAQAGIEQAQAKIPQVKAKDAQAAAKGSQAAALQGYAVLTAPFDGVITKKLFEQGQLATPGYPIYVIEDDSEYRIKFAVPEHLLAGLALGQTVEVVVDAAGAEITTTGTLDVLGAAADPGTHNVNAEAVLVPVAGLFSGRFARVRIPAGEQEQLRIPASAVFRFEEQDYVWRVSASGVINRAPVETMPASAGLLHVIRGLSAGDRIVTEPTAELFPGAQINGAAQDHAAATETMSPQAQPDRTAATAGH
jgi:multidrug efflux pump subunit AcrA (membrane-fusion protein)